MVNLFVINSILRQLILINILRAICKKQLKYVYISLFKCNCSLYLFILIYLNSEQSIVMHYCCLCSGVLFLEFLHECNECLNTFNWHGVVAWSSASTHWSVTLQFNETSLLCLSKELVLKFLVLLYSEGNVSSASISGINWVAVVVLWVVNVVIE